MVPCHPANYAGARAAAIRHLHGGGSGPIFIGSHYQKFMVARRSEHTTAFCGGLDIELRKVRSAWSYTARIGWHGLSLRMEGPITRDVERQYVERWNREQSGVCNALLPDGGARRGAALPALQPARAAKGAPGAQLTPGWAAPGDRDAPRAACLRTLDDEGGGIEPLVATRTESVRFCAVETREDAAAVLGASSQPRGGSDRGRPPRSARRDVRGEADA